jgi:hypothetical protein
MDRRDESLRNSPERDVSVAKYNSSGGRSLKEAVAVFSPAA